MTHNTGRGAGIKWLREHVNYQGDDCLKWPMCIIPVGYGYVGYLGKRYYAHRLMCEMAHGAPPTPKHEAAHLCGKGHEGCVNPRHLAWKTKKENRADCVDHGTAARGNSNRFNYRLTDIQVLEIRGLKGKALHADIAKQFGISPQSVSAIQRRKMYARVQDAAPLSN